MIKCNQNNIESEILDKVTNRMPQVNATMIAFKDNYFDEEKN